MTSHEPQKAPAGTEERRDVDRTGEFVRAAEQVEPGLIAEFWQFLKENKAWWMTPILLALVLLGFVAWLASTAVAPFIYPLF